MHSVTSAGWSEAGLANAITSIAAADAAVKGGSRDAHFALEVMVRTIARRGEDAERAAPPGGDAGRAARRPPTTQTRADDEHPPTTKAPHQRCGAFETISGSDQSAETFFAMADLRFAAWFLWMTPLLTALSSFFEASDRAATALSLSPEAMASFV